MKYSTRQSLTIFWHHSIRYKWQLFLILLGVMVGAVVGTLVPLFYKWLLDSLAEKAAVPVIVNMVWWILFLNAVGWAGFRLATFVNNQFQPRVMADLMNSCFSYLQDQSYSFFANSFTGSLVKRVTRYSRAFEDISDQFLWNFMPMLLRILTILIVLCWRSWILGLVILIWIIVYVGFHYWFSLWKLKYDIAASEADTKTSAHLADAITNNVNIKLFVGQQREFATHKALTNKLFISRKISWDLSAVAEGVQAGLMIVLEFGVLLLAVRYWQKGYLTIGDFALIQAYLLGIFDRLWDLGRLIRRLYERLAEADEMTDILLTPYGIEDIKNAQRLAVTSGRIQFERVSFHYANKLPVLKDFSLNIRPGERIAFIGPSGGGKSTIVKLLFRFYDTQFGSIKIDGQNIAEVTQTSLRQSISLVPQDSILFHRSLFENIRYAKPEATDAEVIAAAKLAHCHEFVSAFPDGYKTFVGERGMKLSGGERQRVAIARAILKDSPILVLDEATSSLDSESEMLIQDALKNLMKNRTTIVIAHRLSTIMQMDRIVVIENGRIKEEGKHDELVKVKRGTYQKLWKIQAGGFSV